MTSVEDFVGLDPNKRYYGFNFGVADPQEGAFIEKKDDLLNESGMVFPVEGTNFDVVFVSNAVMNKLTDDGTSIVPFKTADPLSEALKKKQKALLERYDKVNEDFIDFIKFSPSEAFYRLWIDNNPEGTPSESSDGEDKYRIFDGEWINRNEERMKGIRGLCKEVDIQKTPKTFFQVFRAIDLASVELRMMEEQVKILDNLKSVLTTLQELYDESVKELLAPYDAVRDKVSDGAEERISKIENLIQSSEQSGIELNERAKEFLMACPTVEGNPLEPVCHTFTLCAGRTRVKREGKYPNMSRLELEKKISELDKTLEPYSRKIRALNSRIEEAKK